MMLTLFPPSERVLPTTPHPIQGQYDFYQCSYFSGSFSIIYNVQKTQRGKYIHKLTYNRRYFYNLQKKANQLPPHQLIGR